MVWDGVVVNMNAARYKLFKRSCICVSCGLKGTFFRLHQSVDPSARPDRAHFNLWGVGPTGRLVLFTKDHIVPKSLGGPSHLDNYQTMCSPCNSRKADRMPS